MTVALLILISGPPAAGKTTLSRRLAAEWHLPLVAKDAIKETLFDTLGVRDPAWTRDLGRAGIALLWQFVEASLQAGRSIIAESNFHQVGDSERLADLQDHHGFEICQIHCTAPAPVLWARFAERERSGARHLGHRGALQFQGRKLELDREVFESHLAQGVWAPLRTDGTTLVIDTTHWAEIPWESVHDVIQKALNEK